MMCSFLSSTQWLTVLYLSQKNVRRENLFSSKDRTRRKNSKKELEGASNCIPFTCLVFLLLSVEMVGVSFPVKACHVLKGSEYRFLWHLCFPFLSVCTHFGFTSCPFSLGSKSISLIPWFIRSGHSHWVFELYSPSLLVLSMFSPAIHWGCDIDSAWKCEDTYIERK